MAVVNENRSVSFVTGLPWFLIIYLTRQAEVSDCVFLPIILVFTPSLENCHGITSQNP